MKVCNSSPRLNVGSDFFFCAGIICCGLRGVRSAERQDVVTLCMNFFPTFENRIKSFSSHPIPSLEVL